MDVQSGDRPAGTTRAAGGSSSDVMWQRLVDGLAVSIEEKGYRDVTVADIVRYARTSRRTFYQHFGDRDACFVALMVDRNTRLAERIAAAVTPAAPWRTQVRQAIEGWIEAAMEEPAITLSWIRDAPALGEEAHALQRRIRQAFVDLVENLAGNARVEGSDIAPLTRGLAIMLVGGLRELVAARVEEGDDLTEIVDTAVAAAIALLQPVPQESERHAPGR